jgi:hypothetical protein
MKRLFIVSLVLAALGGCATSDRYYSRVDDRVYYSYSNPDRFHNYYSFHDRYDIVYGYEMREHGS